MGLFGPRPPSEHYTRSRHYQLINPDMPLTTTTDYEKFVDPKQPGSWDARYVPPRKEIIRRVVDRHTNVGAQGFGTLGGATGAVIGGLAGGMLSKSRYGAPVGAIVGGLVGGIPSAIAGGRWGNKRGKRIAKEIPQEPGNVSDFKANHPILSRLYFAKRHGLKKHRAIPYNRAYNAKDISAYNTEVGPIVNVGRSRVVHDKAPIKTGFSKLGYYRENDMTRDDLIEAIINENKEKDIWFLPQNKAEQIKLAERGVLGHLGHGWLRAIGGSVVGGTALPMVTRPFVHPHTSGVIGSYAGAIGNVARYAKKVSYARRGLHRDNSTLVGTRAVPRGSAEGQAALQYKPVFDKPPKKK